jgi:arylsulfatase A-like enzyme
MAERGVRFVQLFHRGWDQHGNLPNQIRGQCKDVDKPVAALIKDLKSKGLLDDTLVVFGGEFGRTVYSQGALTATNYGRDHHGRCFTVLAAGGGMRPGINYGATDDYCYNVVENGVHIHDFHATLLHCLGLDHTKLTFRFQGRDFRLTDVHGNVVKDVLA